MIWKCGRIDGIALYTLEMWNSQWKSVYLAGSVSAKRRKLRIGLDSSEELFKIGNQGNISTKITIYTIHNCIDDSLNIRKRS